MANQGFSFSYCRTELPVSSLVPLHCLRTCEKSACKESFLSRKLTTWQYFFSKPHGHKYVSSAHVLYLMLKENYFLKNLSEVGTELNLCIIRRWVTLSTSPFGKLYSFFPTSLNFLEKHYVVCGQYEWREEYWTTSLQEYNMAKKTQSASKRYKKSFQLAKNAISLGSSV
jgi:hypothetical protein